MGSIFYTPMRRAITLMGILNVTPDSFYDGGEFVAVEKAVARALAMRDEGADIIDIGGESTGPGSEGVSLEEELRRVLPVIEQIRNSKHEARNKFEARSTKQSDANFGVSDFAFRTSDFLLSVDTYKADVARATLQAGASMVNDVTAGRGDVGMFRLIAEAGCTYVMMRSKDDSPRTTKADVQYEDVMRTIHEFFEQRLTAAFKAGIKKDQIIIDPGLGHFVSSDARYSFEILERLEELSDFGCPILVSPSRKSFTAGPENLPPEKRLENTLAATKLAIEHGASIIRTHDVAATRELLRF